MSGETSEIDARVAVEVMGWTRESATLWPPEMDAKERRRWVYGISVPHYSTDIAAALTVVEKLGRKPERFSYAEDFAVIWEKDGWTAGWREYDRDYGCTCWIWPSASAQADTAPMAICLAALAAVTPPTNSQPAPAAQPASPERDEP